MLAFGHLNIESIEGVLFKIKQLKLQIVEFKTQKRRLKAPFLIRQSVLNLCQIKFKEKYLLA
jgi:hypothetical protein